MRRNVFLACLLLSHSLRAQSADWGRLQALPPGTQLVVSTRHTLFCTLDQVTDVGLECADHGYLFPIARSRITRIRLSRSRDVVILATSIGIIAGGAFGAINSEEPARGVGAFAGASLFGYLGYALGHILGRTHGPTIYFNPAPSLLPIPPAPPGTP